MIFDPFDAQGRAAHEREREERKRILGDEEIQKLADEAERGYEIDQLTPVTPERRAELQRHVRELRETFAKSLARKGLDWLLQQYPHLDLVDADAQLFDMYSATVTQRRWGKGFAGPWLTIELGQPSEGEQEAYAIWRFAIWKQTGAVYLVGHDGAVPDDPLYTP